MLMDLDYIDGIPLLDFHYVNGLLLHYINIVSLT